ncbi:MAG: RluA family pseudouridine synthase [Bacteroidales bacterium]|nr:RluA family pseudouridine synthase [Candidatus Physcousia equi]
MELDTAPSHPSTSSPDGGRKESLFTFPFCYVPHPLVVAAAEALKAELRRHAAWKADVESGKMFGVLIAEDAAHELHQLFAFSGTLDGRTQQPGFVPPVYDLMAQDSYFKHEETAISALLHDARAGSMGDTETSKERKEEARRRSVALQRWLFAQYRFLNAKGEEATMQQIFGQVTPPAGTGDCCAPKLLQEAYRRGWKPLHLGEFWMGASPKGAVRVEGQFYPACSSKCKPLLRHMLQGLNVAPNPLLRQIAEPLTIVFEDEHLVVVNKPSGMLAVPGKDALPNVYDEMRERYPNATGPLIVHRLDMDTSGLMVLALDEAAYHHLQGQFVRHEVKKRYRAVLEHELPLDSEGRIDLPLCPDIDDRPRQMVHEKYGKRSITDYRVVENKGGHAIIHLWPQTGRTHQLRVHMAHVRGLGNPIMGDRLYGTMPITLPGADEGGASSSAHTTLPTSNESLRSLSSRLQLYAEELSFVHPVTHQQMHFDLNGRKE